MAVLSLLLFLFVSAMGCAGAPSLPPATDGEVSPKVKSPEAFIAEADQALANERFETAVRGYDAVLAEDPENVRVLYNRSLALFRMGDFVAAGEGFEEVIRRDPDSMDAPLNLGAVWKARGDIPRAISVTERALQKDPFNPRLLNNLSALRRQNGEFEQATEAARKLLMRDKHHIGAYKNLSLVHLERGEIRRAETVLKHALEVVGERAARDPDIYTTLGVIHLQRGERARAMAAFRRATSIDPQHAVANYNMGTLALRHRDYDLAAASYAAAAESTSDDYEVVVGQGFALQGQGRLKEAAGFLEKARALLSERSPSDLEEERAVLEQLVVVHQNAEQPEKALRYADEYIARAGIHCTDEDFEGFCGRYNGIKLMLQMDRADSEGPTDTSRQVTVPHESDSVGSDQPDSKPGRRLGTEPDPTGDG